MCVHFFFSCMQNKTLVSEHEYSARCRLYEGTPTLKIRRRTKSMGPRDFMDDVARSGERANRVQRRIANLENKRPTDPYKESPEVYYHAHCSLLC